MGRGSVCLLSPPHGRPNRSVPRQPAADEWNPGTRRARARGGDPCHAPRDRHGRRAYENVAPRLRGSCVRCVGYRLLRVSQTDLRLAEIIVRLGHPFPAAAAMVGPRVGAPLDRAVDDRVGHDGHPARREKPRSIFRIDGMVAFELARRSARALRVHGRFAPHGARGYRRDENVVADRLQLADLRRGACLDGCSRRAHRVFLTSFPFVGPSSPPTP